MSGFSLLHLLRNKIYDIFRSTINIYIVLSLVDSRISAPLIGVAPVVVEVGDGVQALATSSITVNFL
jgi:hypothetical protein